ncbi:MAG: CHAT domain-containing protein, partial [Pirellulales bacterium]|nr:CHAT domain-containing protein [Pirellulales bacterium]
TAMVSPIARPIPNKTAANNPFLAAGNKIYATLSGDGKTKMWMIPGGTRVSGELGRLLRSMGAGKPRGNRLSADDSWRKEAIALRRRLLPDETDITSERFDDLIVVPDGPLWYLPWEVFPLAGEESPLTGDAIRIRYAATPGLALHPVSEPPANRSIGLVARALFAPRDSELDESITQSIIDVIDAPVRLPGAVDTPSGMLGDSIGHLVVAAPLVVNTQSPLVTSVAGYDQGHASGTVAAWMRFPVVVPRSVIIAGLRTPIDTGQIGSGDEIFKMICGFHAAGVQNVMLSRWAVGGESTAIILRELVQELPFTGMQASWQRARMVLRRGELDPAGEPLLTKSDQEFEGLTGDKPLFWSGYLISAPPQP